MTLGSTLDLQRVEVLKGPQGLLFGQNSTGGAINNVAAKPTASLAAGGGISYERFGLVDADGYISGPLGNTLRGRLAVRITSGGDWQYSYTRPGDRLGSKDQVIGRLLLDWDATDRLRFELNLNGYRDRSDSQAGHLIQSTPNPATAAPELVGLALAPRDARAGNWTPGWPMRLDDWFAMASLRGEYDISDNIQLISVSSYQHLKRDQYSDPDGTAARILDIRNVGKIDAYYQEARLQGKSGPLTWTAGGSYQKADLADNNLFRIDNFSRGNLGFGQLTDAPFFSTQKHESFGLFANGDVKATAHLTFTGGVRYTKDTRSLVACNRAANQVQANTYNFLASLLAIGSAPIPTVRVGDCYPFDATNRPTIAPVRNRRQQDNVSWRGSISYLADSGFLAYGSVSRGFKAGTYATYGATATKQYNGISQEQLTAYEIGAKAPLAGIGQVNAALFYYDYRDKQLRSRFNDVTFGLLDMLVNIPKSHVYGIDADLTVRPVHGMRVIVAATYLKSKIDRYVGINQAGVSENFAGQRFPYTPDLTLTSDADYAWDLRSSLKGFAGGGVSYRTGADAVIDPASGGASIKALYSIDGYALVNLRAGVRGAGDRWEASVFGRNVFNAYYVTNVVKALDTTTNYLGRPATYGVSFRITY